MSIYLFMLLPWPLTLVGSKGLVSPAILSRACPQPGLCCHCLRHGFPYLGFRIYFLQQGQGSRAETRGIGPRGRVRQERAKGKERGLRRRMGMRAWTRGRGEIEDGDFPGLLPEASERLKARAKSEIAMIAAKAIKKGQYRGQGEVEG